MASKGSVILTAAMTICLLCSPFLTGFNVLLVQFPATGLVICFGLIVWLASGGSDFNFLTRIFSVCLVILLISTVYVYSVGHFIGDLAKFIMASIVCWVGLSRADFYIKKPLFLVCAAFCAATIFSSIGVRFYSITEQGDYRFSGLLGNVNLNSYVFLLCCIYLSLIIMRHREGFGKITLILGYVFIQFSSGTKSLIFALPFIAVLCFNLNLKISRFLLFFGILTFILTLGVVWQYLGDVFLEVAPAERWFYLSDELEGALREQVLEFSAGCPQEYRDRMASYFPDFTIKPDSPYF